MTKGKLLQNVESKPAPYKITNATYSMKLSYAMNENLWNSFEHSLTVQIDPDANINEVNKEVWEKVITEVENKIEESQRLYKG